MGAGSMTLPPPPARWKLSPEVAAQTQALVVTGFSQLPSGRALFLEFSWSRGNPTPGWLDALLAVAPVTSAEPPNRQDVDAQSQAAALAFSYTGLLHLGLAETALASFARPFREGMLQQDRLRRLGDRRNGEWLPTVVAGGPVWSGNTPPPPQGANMTGAFDVPHDGPPEEHVQTSVTVHAMLLLYTRDQAAADQWAGQVAATLAARQIIIVHQLDLILNVQAQGNFGREHFGFADALSQPSPYDEGGAVLAEGQPVKDGTQDKVQSVPLGEFLIGYMNGHHEKAPGPVVPAAAGASPQAAGLLPSAIAEGFFDLGLNGSYLVARELKQYVAAFWASMSKNADHIANLVPGQTGAITADWLAERVIGRDRDGHLLRPGGQKLPALSNGDPDSSYLFYEADPRGTGCPAGSHVRRAFPRDALAPNPTQTDTLLQAANNHRILRRGRKFGLATADPRQDDQVDRGLLFMCLNTDIERQFEFVQQTWLLNPAFATLSDEVDPLVGPCGPMTIRETPLRVTAEVDTFVKMAGGDYFFLPSLPALRYLAML